ncbi:kelch repeat domain-containing protein [Parabacteroides merdae]
MKHIYSIFLSAVSLLWMLSGCVEDPDMDTRLQKAKAPEVSETSMEGEAYASSITLKAQIMKENGLPVKECGVCWSTQTGTEPLENMRNKRYTKADKIENHNFTATISNLEDSTKYYVYAYAINDIDTAFSKTEGAYTTINGIGEVATLDVDSATVKATSTWVKGKVKNRGVGIEKLGFYYKKKKQTGDIEPSDQDSVITYEGSDLATVDTFSCQITNLEPETWYYVRAFAKNQFGEFAFNVDSFRTTDGKPFVGKLSLIKDSTTFTTADLFAFLINEGDAPVSAYGFCWSVEEGPTIDADTIICTSLEDDGKFTGRIQGLESAKKYYARAYAINNFGTVYSEEEITISTKSEKPNIITFPITPDSIKSDGTVHIGGELQNGGNSAATEWGICWSSSNKEPSIKDNHVAVDDTLFMYALPSLKGATIYYARTYATNKSGLTGYGEVKSFTTPNIFENKNIYPGANRQFSAGFILNDQNSGSRIYVVGGDLGGERSKEMFGYNVQADEWIPMAECLNAYSQMSAAVYKNQAYLLGGIDKQTIGANCQIYNLDNNWSEPTQYSLPGGRFGAVSFTYRDSLYVLGGSDGSNNMNEILRYDLSSQNIDGSWDVIAKFPAYQRGGIVQVVGDKVYAGLGEGGNGIRSGFWESSDSLKIWNPISIPDKIGSVLSGVYDEQRNSFFMIDNNGKIWEYNLSSGEWTARSLLGYRMNNYHMFMLNGIIYILGQDLYYANKFIKYNPIWDN